MVAAVTPRFTEAEYLALEGVAETRHEFIQGDILGMAGAELDHNQIVQNIRFAFGLQLRGQPCRVLGGDQRVLAEATREYFYPDVLVTCLEPDLVDPAPRSLRNPQTIVEVLSRSTEAKDRGAKWLPYKTIPSLNEYLTVASNVQRIEHHQRGADGWIVKTILEGQIALSNGLVLAFTDAYDMVDLGAASQKTPGEDK